MEHVEGVGVTKGGGRGGGVGWGGGGWEVGGLDRGHSKPPADVSGRGRSV